jgi:hypothetical protein
MPIQKEFEKYGNEETFLRDFLVPLIRRIGFFIVDYHGKREYGRDLIFSEIDRFNNFVYHGLQAKYEMSIGQKESGGLIDDCREAFRHPFQHPITGETGHICNFVVANAGSFGDNTPENFHEDARNREHRGHVRLLDGKALLQLDRSATIARVEQVGETLSGLLFELKHNRTMLERITKTVQSYVKVTQEHGTGPFPIERLRLSAFLHYVQKPILTNLVDFSFVTNYLYEAELGVNGTLDAACTNPPNKTELFENVLVHIGRVQTSMDGLEVTIKAVLDSIGPLAAT